MKKFTVFLFILALCQVSCFPALAEEPNAGTATQKITAARPVIAQAEEAASDAPLDDDLFSEYENSEAASPTVPDPLYYVNYAMYGFNDFFYFHALKPIAQGYSSIVPAPVRTGVGNFFDNLIFPVRFINCLLQGKGSDAADELSSFLINTSLGILGFNDFARKYVGLQPHNEDLGQTLATYRIGDGFYLVLPLLGPSTLRDALGRAGDYFATPLTYVSPWELSWGASGLERINETSFRIGDYEALKEASLDPYVALRNAYLQNRRAQIQDQVQQ